MEELLLSKGFVETEEGKWEKDGTILLDPGTNDNVMYVEGEILFLDLKYLDDWLKEDRSTIKFTIDFKNWRLDIKSKYEFLTFIDDTEEDWGDEFRVGKTIIYNSPYKYWMACTPDGYEVGVDKSRLYDLLCTQN